MFRLHIVHLLNEWTRHFSRSEDRVGKACLSGIGDGFVIDHVLERQLFEELLSALQIRCRFQIGLLILVLLWHQQFVLSFFGLFIVCCGLAHHIWVWVSIHWLRNLTLCTARGVQVLELLRTVRIYHSWLLGLWLLLCLNRLLRCCLLHHRRRLLLILHNI